MTEVEDALAEAIAEAGGVLKLNAALVARDWITSGRRLGLSDDRCEVGARGTISERWLASTTHADNAVGPDDEGISYIRRNDGTVINLASAVAGAPDLLLGEEYASLHGGLQRLAKIYDFASRIPFHIHPPKEVAERVGRHSKDEACYFPDGVPFGPHPETFFGLHPGLSVEEAARTLVEEWRAWDSDRVLGLSQAYLNLPGGGFYVPSGILHAPGTALTIELQEDADTLAMLQGVNDGRAVDKRLLFKDVADEDKSRKGESALLDWIDWEGNLDPYFYENHHIAPQVFAQSDDFEEAWILYGSTKFSGKRLTIRPGRRYVGRERGVFNLLAWRGRGTIGGQEVVGGSIDDDELLVVHDRAVQDLEYVNTGDTDLVIIKFFGPGLNPDAPIVHGRQDGAHAGPR